MLLPRRNASILVGILIYIVDRRISNSNISTCCRFKQEIGVFSRPLWLRLLNHNNALGRLFPRVEVCFFKHGFSWGIISCHLMRDVKAAFTPYLRNSFCPRQASLIHVLWYVHGTCLVSKQINLVLQSRTILSDSHCGSYNIMRWICIILYVLKTFYYKYKIKKIVAAPLLDKKDISCRRTCNSAVDFHTWIWISRISIYKWKGKGVTFRR